MIKFNSEKDMPPLVVSLGNTLYNKTGSWRYMRPVYHDKTAPCCEACPAGSDVEGYVYLTSQGRLDEAWKLVMKENPFPSVCGRVCYHPCETSCNRGKYDEKIRISSIERIIGDYGFNMDIEQLRIRKNNGFKVAIVGAGPSGLTCAYHLARLGYGVDVFEASKKPGGVLRYGIPSYRLPKNILDNEIAHIEKLGVTIRTGVCVGKDVEWDSLLDYDAVYLSFGVHKSRKLNIEGEDAIGVIAGLKFLEKINKGENVEIGKRVAIIGGGNTAMDAARVALRLGSSPTIYYRRSRNEMPAIEEEIEQVKEEGIKIEFLVSPVSIEKDKTGNIRAIKFTRMRLGEPDESGRRKSIPIKGEEFSEAVDYIITATGEVGDFAYLHKDIKVENNTIKVNEIGQTTIEKVFAGGDIIEQPHTVVHAIGAGKRAAMAIDSYINKKDFKNIVKDIQVGYKGSLSFRRYVEDLPRDPVDNREVVGIENVNLDHFQHQAAKKIRIKNIEDRIGNFQEVKDGFDEKTAIEESKRCFNCGVCNMCDNCLIYCPDMAIKRREDGYRYYVDYDYCKGCGICVQECPRSAISFEPEGR